MTIKLLALCAFAVRLLNGWLCEERRGEWRELGVAASQHNFYRSNLTPEKPQPDNRKNAVDTHTNTHSQTPSILVCAI